MAPLLQSNTETLLQMKLCELVAAQPFRGLNGEQRRTEALHPGEMRKTGRKGNLPDRLFSTFYCARGLSFRYLKLYAERRVE